MKAQRIPKPPPPPPPEPVETPEMIALRCERDMLRLNNTKLQRKLDKLRRSESNKEKPEPKTPQCLTDRCVSVRLELGIQDDDWREMRSGRRSKDLFYLRHRFACKLREPWVGVTGAHFDGMSYPEIAKVMGVSSHSTVLRWIKAGEWKGYVKR